MSNVVLITGTSTGFGRLTAELLAAEGNRVYATMRDPAGRNAGPASELSSVPGVRVLGMDVTDEGSVNAAVATILSEAGRVDCVVNNAGFGNFGLTECFTPEQWLSIFDTNVFGCVRVNRAVLPSMRGQRSGLLIHVTSIAGRLPATFLGPYSSSKWALEGYAEVLRLELAPLGVDSVVVEPGKYRTAIFDKTLAPADGARAGEYAEGDLSGRFMEAFVSSMDALAQDPADVARAISGLIKMPASERPFRTPVGEDAVWLADYNSAADSIREKVAEWFNLPEMLPYRKAAAG